MLLEKAFFPSNFHAFTISDCWKMSRNPKIVWLRYWDPKKKIWGQILQCLYELPDLGLLVGSQTELNNKQRVFIGILIESDSLCSMFIFNDFKNNYKIQYLEDNFDPVPLTNQGSNFKLFGIVFLIFKIILEGM